VKSCEGFVQRIGDMRRADVGSMIVIVTC